MALHGSAATTCRVPGPSATSARPQQAQPPLLRASSGVAQLHGLALGCRENSRVGKRHVGSLVRSVPPRFTPELPFISAVPLGACPSHAPVLPLTTGVVSSASTSLLGTRLPAAGWAVGWPCLLPPDLLCSLRWGTTGLHPVGKDPDPRPKQPLQRATNNPGNRNTLTLFLCTEKGLQVSREDYLLSWN